MMKLSDEIERRVELMFDAELAAGQITQDEYEIRVKEISRWAADVGDVVPEPRMDEIMAVMVSMCRENRVRFAELLGVTLCQLEEIFKREMTLDPSFYLKTQPERVGADKANCKGDHNG